ncbi:MAG: SulP family inorganic anion transporter, partial [Cyanobacteria bacterium]|nr:SulP family inorganic anion transporter [Cyanobacteriota bacterium]
GQAIPMGEVMGPLTALPQLIAAARLPEVILAVVTVAIIWFTPSLVKRLAPPLLVALVIGTVLSLTLLNGGQGAEVEGMRRISEIPSGFPQLVMPHFEPGLFQLMVVDALVLMAVLAGIALKVRIDIIDWSFLRRAHHVLIKGAVIRYGVILLTMLVDLIAAVGVGIFVANILTIEKMSTLETKSVKAISTADDDLNQPENEKALLDQGGGKVLLFQLIGLMIFGLAKTISRKHNAMQECESIVVDLSEVSPMGVTASLALENAVKEALGKERNVDVVGAEGSTLKRLRSLKVYSLLPHDHVEMSRAEALADAVNSRSQIGMV